VTGSTTPDRRPDATGLQAAIVAASGWHTEMVAAIAAQARREAAECGVDGVVEAHVAGAGELPLVAQALARREDINAIVAVGVVVRGRTPHFATVLHRATEGLLQVALREGVPIGDAVVAGYRREQVLGRTQRGAEAMRAALQQALILRAVRTGRTLPPLMPISIGGSATR
jgi:6,7-dimethyl-8-ribityllumazine synthase